MKGSPVTTLKSYLGPILRPARPEDLIDQADHIHVIGFPDEIQKKLLDGGCKVAGDLTTLTATQLMGRFGLPFEQVLFVQLKLLPSGMSIKEDQFRSWDDDLSQESTYEGFRGGEPIAGPPLGVFFDSSIDMLDYTT